MCVLLHEKRHMPRLCQNMKLSDVINPRINSSGAREIEVNTLRIGSTAQQPICGAPVYP